MDINDLKRKHMELFGSSEKGVRIFTSPGRVNLIGEHVDYNGGFVLPAALTMGTRVAVCSRDDDIIRLAATDLDVMVEANYADLNDYRDIEWGNYQLGVADILMKEGYKLKGADLLYHDTLPHGGGLSSSAAIEVATALALVSISTEEAEDTAGIKDTAGTESRKGVEGRKGTISDDFKKKLALISQRAESEYAGVNCGIMDQFASALGKKDHCILLDCDTLDHKWIPMNMGENVIIIANTNKKRSLADSKYNERRRECDAGLSALRKRMPDKANLAQITMKEFEANKDVIEDEIIQKRVRHVVGECGRVLESVDKLIAGDIRGFGELMNASHESLRDLYEVTGIELDTLAEEAWKIDGVVGSRMTGAGFGGCTVSIVKKDRVDHFIDEVGRNYKAKIGYEASFYISEIGDGCREL